MKSRRVFAQILASSLAVGALAGCGSGNNGKTDVKETASEAATSSTNQNSPAAAKDGEEPWKVLCLLNGSLGDKGFYDNAASGMYRLRDELGYEINVIEMGRDETTYKDYFIDESEKDWDLIISTTFSVKDLVSEIAVEYPEQKYMCIDTSLDFDVVTTGNVMGVTYQSNETGFMGGALAALMLKSDNEKVDATEPVLGFVGSMDSANINDFLVGYIEGIQYIDPEIKLLTSYVGSFNDVAKCLEMTTQLYNQGAQIVYAPASQSILGAVQAAADTDHYFIACDNDIWNMMSESNPDMVNNVLSSTLKNVGDSLFDAVTGLREGTYQVGENYVLGIKDGAVGLAVNANYEEKVPADIRAKLEEINSKIEDGSITVGSAFGMSTDEVASLRDGMKP